MLKQKAQQLLYQSVLSVHWHEDENGIQLQSLICSREGKEVVVEKQLPPYSTLENLVAESGIRLPVVLIISGKGVLQSTNGTSSTSWPDLLHQRLPGADADAFTAHLMQEPSILNIIRKDKLRDIIEVFAQYRLTVVAYYLGATPLEVILPLLRIDEYLFASPYLLSFKHGAFENIQATTVENTSNSAINIGEQQLFSHHLLSFAGAISQIVAYHPVSFNEVGASGRDAYELNQYSKWLGLSGLGIIFAALLINFLSYSSANKQLSQVEGELYYSQSLIVKMDSLSSQVTQRQTALGDQPIRQSQLSKLGDDLGSSVPEGIRIRVLSFFPTQKTSPTDRSGQISYRDDTLLIRGETHESSLINEWIDKLEQIDWVQDVQLLPYRSGNNNTMTFELQVAFQNNLH
jgi:Tfp pilus assembly protein PilN